MSDKSVNGWGWRFVVYPIMPLTRQSGTDREVLSRPCLPVVRNLLHECLKRYCDLEITKRLTVTLMLSLHLTTLSMINYLIDFAIIYINHEKIYFSS